MGKQITIEDAPGPDHLKIVNATEEVSVRQDKEVEWVSSLPDWRVIFGPYAPVHPKVASPKRPTLKLKGGRAEDYGTCKYVVVALVGDVLEHEDPVLIVRP